MKCCRTCHLTKPLSDYHTRRSYPGAPLTYRATCKECHRDRRRETARDWRRLAVSNRPKGRGIYRLPSAPLCELIEAELGRRQMPIVEVSGLFGISDRTFRAWKRGVAVDFSVADHILSQTPYNWFDVWGEDKPGHEIACEAFTGEKVAA